MKNISKRTSFYLLMLLLLTASSTMAASISADLIMTKSGKTETGKFYLLNQHYRMDVIEDGKPLVVIADREKNVHRFFDMEGKVFFEIPSDDFRILTSDPFKASEYMVAKYGSKVQGNEKIDGIACERQDVIVENKTIHSRWFSDKLKFPIKLVSYDGEKESYVTELKNIREDDLQKERFAPPAGFKQVEEPGAAEERKRENLRKQEEALAGLTAVETTQVPCYAKIAAGGELRIQIDTDRKAYLEITNQTISESEIVLQPYCNGKPSESRYDTTWKLKGKGDRQNFDFNDGFVQSAESYLVDEVRIKVEKGLVYAMLRQFGEDRTDSYNSGGQTDFDVDQKRSLALHITGDNPFGDQTTGKFRLRYAAGGSSGPIPFTVETGKTSTWEYTAEKGVNVVIISISKGNGRAKISLIQPPLPEKAVPDPAAVKNTQKTKDTPKAKTVNEFSVTHPAGTSKPLIPGRDLVITVTGVTEGAKGDVELFSDPEKTQKIDHFGFTLKQDQAKSHFVSRDRHAVWARVSVYKGAFGVKLDQSPGVKAASAPPLKQKKQPAAEPPQPKKASAAVSTAAQPTASSDQIFNGEVPLYNGARVIKTKTSGPYTTAELQADATPQELVDFYKQAMSGNGWEASLAMVQGNKGVLMLKQSGRQLVFKVKGQGDTSKVSITLINQ